MSVGDVSERKERPPYVKFERRAIEDVAATKREGRYIAKDVDFALIHPPYSKDCVEQKVSTWLENTKKNVRDGRIPEQWLDGWKEGYEKWKNGQEIPLDGTPIKGWGIISPAQQEMLIRINCMTVEDLARVNDEGLRRIGMGALDLRNKAKNWLQTVTDHGPLTIKMSVLEKENAVLQSQIETLMKQVEALSKNTGKDQRQEQEFHVSHETITASDLLEEDSIEKQYQAKFGKPPHHRMSAETIKRKIHDDTDSA